MLDGMDALYANTGETDESGRYIPCYTRENGSIEFRPFTEYKGLADLRSENEYLSNPVPARVSDKNTYTFDMRVPIRVNGRVAGYAGMTIELDSLQSKVMHIRPYKTGHVAVFSNNGTVAAHYDSDLRGSTYLLSSAKEAGSVEIFGVMQNARPAIFRMGNALAACYPIEVGATLTPWAVLTSVPTGTILAPIFRLIRFALLFIIGSGLVAALVIYRSSGSIINRSRFLQKELEKSTTMKDSLKYGIFLMDRDFIIQDAYSKALTKILALSELRGKNFLRLLDNSVNAREIQGLSDYFSLFFGGSHDPAMLEDINPISEFEYISAETGEQKVLRSAFTLAGQDRGMTFILGTLEDISAQKELEKQLAETETKREEEMRSLFELIQVEPQIFGDFIEDTEYEFERINDTLKDRRLSAKEAMTEIYQSVHAMKSNALILGLQKFSGRLHELETGIKKFRDQDVVSFEDVLHVTVQLEQIMRERDRFQKTIDKFRSFKTGMGGRQDRHVLIETLSRACEKSAEALGKQVRFSLEELDDAALEKGPRRVIKEVLTQMVRNAVSHGVESPDVREKQGKAAVGTIRLSIKTWKNEVHIKFSDDGSGLDFIKIREKAEALNLIKGGEDKNQLLKFIFSAGFSTAEKTDGYAGRGMGLSLVRERVKELRGTIRVQSEAGKGTTFYIVIPMEMPLSVIEAS
jgi:two-component system chemotaxis sensor kinase CheA